MWNVPPALDTCSSINPFNGMPNLQFDSRAFTLQAPALIILPSDKHPAYLLPASPARQYFCIVIKATHTVLQIKIKIIKLNRMSFSSLTLQSLFIFYFFSNHFCVPFLSFKREHLLRGPPKRCAQLQKLPWPPLNHRYNPFLCVTPVV